MSPRVSGSWFAVLALLAACGGAPPAVVTPAPSASVAPVPSASAPDAPPASAVSVVRFDDLGVSFAVPSGFRVLGDDDLAARIRASASPRLTAALEKRGSQKKGIPLLSLARETTERGDGLSVTISVAVVPQDATAAEVVAQQKVAMGENLDTFAVVEDAKERTTDGVAGTELAVRYVLHASGEAHRVASFLRIFVRGGLAFLAVAVWPEAAGRAEAARLTLDGLHFYAPQP
jgi:hypothetical protein